MAGPEGSDESLETLERSTSGVLMALNSAEIAIFVLDSDFSVQWINETTETYFGLSREAVIGEDKRTLIESTIQSKFERPERFAETVIDTYEDNTYVEEFECHILPGSQREERWLLHQSRPITEGEFAGGRVEHYIDITERKERELALQRERDRLDEFAGVISHDLRNPLHVATARLELAQLEYDSAHFPPMADALDRMEGIINDMLWLAREGRDIGDTSPVDLQESAESAWSLVADETESTALQFDIASGRTVIEADADRLSQLLENILGNAIEHGGEGVTVRVESTDDGFAIEDDGPGISPAERDRIFEAGYSSSESGTGFGLRIVEQVVDAHGWRITVTDGAENGARFEISGVTFVDEST